MIHAKTTSAILIFFMIGISAFSQREESDLNPKDPKAQEILDALSNKAKEFKSFSADFEYTLTNDGESINETQKGSVKVKGNKKYQLNIAGQQITSNGETVWTFIEDVGELQISDMPEEDEEEGNIMNPSNLFHMYKKGFKYQYDGQATVDGKSAEVIRMFPVDPGSKPYHTVVVNVDKPNLELVSMIVKYKDGNIYTYRLKNFKSNINLTDADFEFDESKADDIIDLRE
ncbi:MAG: outer membrane lipoprotein carrier protein LolA [Salibacteraceae bacterium]